VLAFADVVDLLPDELAGLGAGTLPLALGAPGSLDRPLFWHPSTSFLR